MGLCPNSIHGYSCDNITYVFRSQNKAISEAVRGSKTALSSNHGFPNAQQRGSWVSHGRNSTAFSLIHFRCLAVACTISPALLSSCPTSYSASPLHRAPRLQPVARFYHSSMNMKVCSPWRGESKVSIEDLIHP